MKQGRLKVKNIFGDALFRPERSKITFFGRFKPICPITRIPQLLGGAINLLVGYISNLLRIGIPVFDFLQYCVAC